MTANTSEQLIRALEESNSLFAALMHEPRDYDEIEAQLVQNRDAIVSARRAPVVQQGYALVSEEALQVLGVLDLLKAAATHPLGNNNHTNNSTNS